MAKKKKRIKWGNVCILLLVFCGILSALGYGCYWCGVAIGRLFAADTSAEAPADASAQASTDTLLLTDHATDADPALLEHDSTLCHRLDRLIAQSVQLDTTILAISLYHVNTGRYVYQRLAERALIPASCMKIPTAIAALDILGDSCRYRTIVYAQGTMQADTLVGRLLLQVDDDPMLTSLDTLATQIRTRGIACIRGTIDYEFEREDQLDSHPSTPSGDITTRHLPVTLRGSQHLQSAFREALRRASITYRPADVALGADTTWREVACYETSLRDVITPMLIHSSNVKAEALLYKMNRRTGLLPLPQMDWDILPATHYYWKWKLRRSNGYDSIPSTIEQAVFKDGSGLSPSNRLTTHVIVEMLRYAWRNPSMRQYFIDEALASPGIPNRSGSLTTRMNSPQFRQRVFVKTGTLTLSAASSLSGYLRLADNDWYIFSIINQNCPVAEARLFQDRFCATVLGI